ncbi:MAG TPA: ChaN family lipoprotein [Saprospiraceae bacterium]|nr:ChaN family lipoprotein [Saprospiraceae bacterium]
MTKTLMLFCMVILATIANAQKMDAYKLYDARGRQVKFERMLNVLSQSDVVLFGELHNNPVCHWMQLELSKGIFEKNGSLIMGGEMFESDNQLLIDEYFAGLIRQRNFEEEMRLWPNYKTDYKPMLEFAKDKNIRFVATNIPRRYAALVNQNGFEGLNELSDEAKRFLPILPVPYDPEAPNYREMSEMDMGGGHGKGGVPPNMVKAQAIKDATMAYFISKNFEKDKVFIHFQGDFHSKNHGAIVWYLQQYNPRLKVSTISTVEAEDLEFRDEYKPLADFILVIPESMTKTH